MGEMTSETGIAHECIKYSRNFKLPIHFIIEDNQKSVCTETYLQIGPFKSKKTCENVISYIHTKFFRFLVLMIKNTQHATKNVYRLVPVQDFENKLDDKNLYKKYKLTENEIKFIDTMIRPME